DGGAVPEHEPEFIYVEAVSRSGNGGAPGVDAQSETESGAVQLGPGLGGARQQFARGGTASAWVFDRLPGCPAVAGAGVDEPVRKPRCGAGAANVPGFE